MSFDPKLLLPLALMGAFLVLDRRVWSILEAEPDGEKKASAAGLDQAAYWLIVPIVLAVTAFYVAKTLHHHALGLYIAVGVLILNAFVVAVVRLRAFRDADVARETKQRLARVQLLSTVFTVLAYTSVLAYLLSWY